MSIENFGRQLVHETSLCATDSNQPATVGRLNDATRSSAHGPPCSVKCRKGVPAVSLVLPTIPAKLLPELPARLLFARLKWRTRGNTRCRCGRLLSFKNK